MKCSLIHWYTLTYARDKLGILYTFQARWHTLVYVSSTLAYTGIRFKHAGIHWYTLTYARDKLGIGFIRFKHAGIRWHTLVYADIRWHLLTFVVIPGPKPCSYATHRFNTVSILFVYVQYWAFCAYEKYFKNFHTQLLHFSHTQQCDRAINSVLFNPCLPATMAQWLCHRVRAGRYWVRISVLASTLSGFLTAQWVGVRPLHLILSL